jgi:hypothetical protein
MPGDPRFQASPYRVTALVEAAMPYTKRPEPEKRVMAVCEDG